MGLRVGVTTVISTVWEEHRKMLGS